MITPYYQRNSFFSIHEYFPIKLEQEDVFDTEDPNAYGFGSNNPSSPTTYLGDINSNELNSPPPLEEYSNSFEAIGSEPINNLKRKRESDILRPFKPFETGIYKLNFENLENVTSDSVSSHLESIIGKVEIIKLTCLNPNCKDTSFENFNKEISLCHRCWVDMSIDGKFPESPRTHRKAARKMKLKKTVQKMKAANLVCKNPDCNDDDPTEFLHKKGLCRRCWQYFKRNDSYPKEFRRKSRFDSGG